MKIKKGDFPKVDDKGFFELFHDLKHKKQIFQAGADMKLLEVSKSGKMWCVRPKFHKNETAIWVNSSKLAKQ
jgi:hypothetical protein